MYVELDELWLVWEVGIDEIVMKLMLLKLFE